MLLDCSCGPIAQGVNLQFPPLASLSFPIFAQPMQSSKHRNNHMNILYYSSPPRGAQTLHPSDCTSAPNHTIPTNSLTLSGLRFRRYDVPQMPCMKTHGICSSKPISSPIPSANLPKPKLLQTTAQQSFPAFVHKTVLFYKPTQQFRLLNNQPKCPSVSSPPAQRVQLSAHLPAHSLQQRHSRRQRRIRRKRRLRRRIRQLVRRAWLLLRKAVRHFPSLPIPHSHFAPSIPLQPILPSTTITLIPTACPPKTKQETYDQQNKPPKRSNPP